MDLNLSSEQQQLVDAFASLYSRECPPERVRAAEGTGFDKVLWERLLETGATAMGVDEEHGGFGASLLDLALVAEQQGRALAPAPVIEAQVAMRALSRLEAPAAADALGSALEGERIVTMGVRPAHRGSAALVPAASVADQAVVLDGDRLLLVGLQGNTTPVRNLGSMPLADVTIPGDAVVLATGADARAAHRNALDEWMTLTANALNGLAARALEIGVDYTKERVVFGKPIGSYQGVSHRLADSASDVSGSRLLGQEAAWAPEGDPERFPELAAMAFGFAAETARDTTYWSLHFHGGYGFMLEYDIQLFFRRARAWAMVLGEPRETYRRVADARYGTVES